MIYDSYLLHIGDYCCNVLCGSAGCGIYGSAEFSTDPAVIIGAYTKEQLVAILREPPIWTGAMSMFKPDLAERVASKRVVLAEQQQRGDDNSHNPVTQAALRVNEAMNTLRDSLEVDWPEELLYEEGGEEEASDIDEPVNPEDCPQTV